MPLWHHFLDDDSLGQLTRATLPRDLGTIAREQFQGRSRAEMVSWLFPVRDDMVANKDGSILAAFEFDGLDTDSTSPDHLEGLGTALNKLLVFQQDEPLTQWWTVRRTRTTAYPDSVFPDPVSQRIDNARRDAFLAEATYVNRHFLAIALQPAVGAMRMGERIRLAVQKGASVFRAVWDAARHLMDDQRVFPYSPSELDEACVRFSRLVADITGMLPQLRFRRLEKAALGGFLHDMASIAAPETPLAMPVDSVLPVILDSALPEGMMAIGRDFMVSLTAKRKFTVAVTITEYSPTPLELGGLDRLYSVPGEMTITFTVRFMSRFAAERHATRMRDFHTSKMTSLKGLLKKATGGNSSTPTPTNRGRSDLADAASNVLGQITKGATSGLWLYVVVLCHGDTLEEADATAERVESVIRSCHLRPERESLHLLSAFTTSIPGGWKECARWKFFTSEAFSMVAPVHTVVRGALANQYLAEQTTKPAPALAVFPTEHATPFYFNTHVADLGHGFIAGPAGAGKTTLANLIAAQFRRYPDSQVIFFDKDLSSRISILLQGGTYIDFAGDNASARFNPIGGLTYSNLEQRMAWIELLMAQRGFAADADDSKELESALRATLTLPPELRRLSTIFSHLTRPGLKSALEPWVGDRLLARYFDNELDGFDHALREGGSRLIGLEVGKLLKHPQVAIPMMDHCFSTVDAMLVAQRAQGAVRPTFLYLAEVWHLLQNEQTAEKLLDWLKTLRKRCAVVWMDTQSVDDLAESNIFSALRDNIPNRIFLPNPNATSESLHRLYSREFELSPNQIKRIAEGTQKRDYFIQHGPISRMVQLRLSPDTVACLRSDMAAQIIFDKHYAGGAGAPGWQERYIQEVQTV